MRRVGRFAAGASSVAVVMVADVGFAASSGPITADAVWHPDQGFLDRAHRQCDARAGVNFATCLGAAMAKAGASAAALAFARRLGNDGYLQALKETAGPVAVAHVLYPFRANENEAWLLVNGTPPLIDVDDQQYLALAAMRTSGAYEEIRRRYPNVTFWPGDRGVAGPAVAQVGREFVVDYLLRDLCHACATIGRVRYAFDFNANGKFLGTRLVSVAVNAR